MELQAVAQRDPPQQAIILDDMPFGHLRMRPKLFVDP